MRDLLPSLAVVLLGAACSTASPSPSAAQAGGTERAPALPEGRAEAIFAGGCFWCMEGPFEALDGVDSVVYGYTGGTVERPTYHQVSSGRTGHAEAVRVVYDPAEVSYEELLEVFWHNVDPTQADGQFCDHGPQYRTGIFVGNAEERRLAEASKAAARAQLGRPIVTEITDAGTFWVAEAYHQDYHRTHPSRYMRYRVGCGRDARLRQLWGEAAGH
ncbi:MAG: peptide-methionine (S)-S-oxide reductase MsrA [Sandaracinaceae bacterium]